MGGVMGGVMEGVMGGVMGGGMEGVMEGVLGRVMGGVIGEPPTLRRVRCIGEFIESAEERSGAVRVGVPPLLFRHGDTRNPGLERVTVPQVDREARGVQRGHISGKEFNASAIQFISNSM